MEITKTVVETSFSIVAVRSKQDLDAAISLFETYAKSLGIDLAFQDFKTEISTMPGKYAPPKGALFLASSSEDEEAIGCVGLRPLPSVGEGVCEIKRLYVDPQSRGMGIGRALAETAIDEAKRLGYGAIVLDTLSSMASARAVYSMLGFVEIEAYYESPIVDTTFMRLDL